MDVHGGSGEERSPQAEAAIDLRFGFVIERWQRVGKDRPVGVIAVMGLQSQSDCFCRA